MQDIHFNMSDHIDRAKLMVSVRNKRFIKKYSCQRATIMKRYAFFSSWNSAHFDRRTISLGQVVPKIPLNPPPPLNLIFQLIYTDFRDDPKFTKIGGIPRIRGKV